MKKKIISMMLCISMAALTACQNGSPVSPAPADNGTSSGYTVNQPEGNTGDTAATDQTDQAGPDSRSEQDDKGFPSAEEVKNTENEGFDDKKGRLDNKSADIAIEQAGRDYDGYTAYEHPTVDSILLGEGSEWLSMDLDEYYKACTTPQQKELVSECEKYINDFRSCFREIKVYKPQEGVSIAIADKKLYEYDLDDTNKILDTAHKIEEAYYSMPSVAYTMPDEDGFSIGGMVNSISGAFKKNINRSAAMQTEGLAMNDYASVASEEAVNDAAYMDPGVPAPAAGPDIAYDSPEWNTEEYKSFSENRFMSAQTSPFSTFGMDVDTASYSNFRKKVFNNESIPVDSIRVEEMMNYFDYDYVEPEDGKKFGISLEIADTPWNTDTRLLKVGVKTEDVDTDNIRSNVVFLIDTSGSMFDADKLPLVQKSFLMLLDRLDEKDTVSIVTYAGSDTVICKGIPCDKKEQITKDIISLEAWGGTNGAAGIKTAYEIAGRNFIKDGNNRVILATDGDLNLGITSESDLVDLIKKEKESGVFLSVLGVGEGNYKDSKMKALADNGNGNFAYIDSTSAADKALHKDFESLMYTVAKDAKMQLEFNPAKIKGYRQIGYELRQLNTEDFADDTKDGSEIGSGKCVTVLYEIVPSDSDMDIAGVESKYNNTSTGDASTDELLTVSIRYKQPDEDKSELIEIPVTNDYYRPQMSDDMSWAAGIAQTAMLLRDSEYKGTSSYREVYDRLKNDIRIVSDKDRAQFLYMVDKLDNERFDVVEDDYYYGY